MDIVDQLISVDKNANDMYNNSKHPTQSSYSAIESLKPSPVFSHLSQLLQAFTPTK